jgi:hypothetical protein
VTNLPTDGNELRAVRGIGKARRGAYGQEIIEMILQYLGGQQVAPNKSPPTKPRTQPHTSETKLHSFNLFRAGKTVEEIAAERRLARSTIEGHLAHFIGLGELDVHSVLDPQTVADIQQFLKSNPDAGVAEAKSHFGEKYSYGELTLVTSHIAAVREEVKAG